MLFPTTVIFPTPVGETAEAVGNNAMIGAMEAGRPTFAKFVEVLQVNPTAMLHGR